MSSSQPPLAATPPASAAGAAPHVGGGEPMRAAEAMSAAPPPPATLVAAAMSEAASPLPGDDEAQLLLSGLDAMRAAAAAEVAAVAAEVAPQPQVLVVEEAAHDEPLGGGGGEDEAAARLLHPSGEPIQVPVQLSAPFPTSTGRLPAAAAERAPSAYGGGSGGAAISAADVAWGGHVLEVTEHPSVRAAVMAVLLVLVLQDVSMPVALIAGSSMMVFDFGLTLVARVGGKLRHWPYALSHCFFWPLVSWAIVVCFFQQPQFALWAGVVLWGGVAALMAMTLAYGRPWAGDLLKDKTPQAVWGADWWHALGRSLSVLWVAAFALMAAAALAPALVHRRSGRRHPRHILDMTCNALAPLLLGALALVATRSQTNQARAAWLLAPGAVATAGGGAALGPRAGGGGGGGGRGGYERLAGGDSMA